uniref:Cytochrome c oxidase subunit 3 n=1 Tax=Leptomyrmex pallens TaxID=611136 RepID=V5JF47_9HYME|nr:cytochrome c oxidase subunit III [Leptomyrmex pallens]AGL61396.1 cytochrome c oxidase subunit III [Leptomyrmex pallens]
MTNFIFTHPFHLVTISPWPLLTSISIMNNFLSLISWFHNPSNPYFLGPMSLMASLLCIFQWWRDVCREATFQGHHTSAVYSNMRIGMILFIISEILFFMSFFWAYFHFSLAPAIEIGQIWPPKNITPFDPLDIPLLNTIILISSGMTITWSHHSLLKKVIDNSSTPLILTICLGLLFSTLQLFEYKKAPFTISDSVYGSIFFVATGFHGLHVIIGTLFLIVTLWRMHNLHFSSTHHFGFEAASWYWHFVDVVWLFLYLTIYWWGHF